MLRGPDRRTPFTRETRSVAFAGYAPAGVGEDAVRRLLQDVRENVLLVAPDARTEAMVTLAA